MSAAPIEELITQAQAQQQVEQAQRELAEAGQRTEELEAILAKYRERFGEPIE